ncbi:MAG: glycosyltransferase family 39 protein [Flavobacterium sp.]
MKNFSWLKEHKFLVLILSLGILLRFYHLDFQSVWLDEIHTLNEANPNLSFMEMYDLIKVTEPHPPLYFILIKIAFSIFGYSTFVLRFFSALIGVIGILAIYKLGKELVNKQVGIISALLLSLNYFHLYHSQDGRMYALLFLTTVISFYFFIKFWI